MGDNRRDVPSKGTDTGIKGMAVLLTKLDEGGYEREASDEMHELCKRLAQHATHFGKAKGEIVMTLKFDVDNAGTCNIATDLNIKEPKPIRGRTMVWLDRQNYIALQNPRQGDLPGIREVPRPAAPVDVDTETGEVRDLS